MALLPVSPDVPVFFDEPAFFAAGFLLLGFPFAAALLLVAVLPVDFLRAEVS